MSGVVRGPFAFLGSWKGSEGTANDLGCLKIRLMDKQPVPGSKMVGKVWGKRVEKKYAKIAWGLGRDRVVKITVYLFLVYPMIGQL